MHQPCAAARVSQFDLHRAKFVNRGDSFHVETVQVLAGTQINGWRLSGFQYVNLLCLIFHSDFSFFARLAQTSSLSFRAKTCL